MKIGIYGGSFNPVHYGHLNVAKTAIAELGLDQLLVIPAALSPFKVENSAPEFPNRLEMVVDAFAALDRVKVDLREIQRGGVSYAIDTIREIAKENIGAEIIFIVGEDSVEGLPRWKDYHELLKLCSFKSFPRTKESSTEIRRLFAKGNVVENPERQVVEVVRRGLKARGGYCPCRLPKIPEFFCPCDEFKGQLADTAFHGLCHCRLYLKK